jgi:protoporphyrinogen oxidase
MDEKRSWAVIGGGIMGMTIASRLSGAGHQVILFESSSSPGGLAGSMEINGISWDRFYHVILMSDLNTREMIRSIGLEKELVWTETKTGFFSGGKLYSMSNIFEYLRFPAINLVDKFRLGLTIIAASRIRNWKRMESIHVETWLKRWSGRRVFNKIWLPLLKSKLGDHYKDTSASFIWATIRRMYAARRTGLKKEMFGYVSGGYRKINDAFLRKILDMGVDVRLNTSVIRVRKDKNETLTLSLSTGQLMSFDNVISTLPSDVSVRIAPELKNEEVEKHQAIRYIGVVCPVIFLKRPLSPYYVTNITDSWPPFTGIIEMTALVDRSETGNLNLVYLPKYVEPENELFNVTNSELKERFYDSLMKMYPDLNSDDIIAWDVSSARRVFALPVLNYSEKLPSAVTSLKGYYIINSAQIVNGTLNVNETLEVGEARLNEILNPAL